MYNHDHRSLKARLVSPTTPNSMPRVAAAAALVLATGATTSAGAVDLYLKAHRTSVNVPVSATTTTTVPMWTYSRCDADFTTNCVSLLDGGGSAGPLVSVPAGPLTIHLRNNLEEPTSVYIPGQTKSLTPVRQGERITSFDTETAPGSVGTYTWTNPRAGTFLLQSGTHPQKQVQMGLHGAIRFGSPVVPAGETVAIERSLVFSEIDPDLHGDGTSAGSFAANAAPAIRPVPVGQVPQGYAPKYFLVNGRVYSDGSALDAALGTIRTGDGVLVDLVNAGLETHAPEMLGGEFEVTAEDGYATPARQLRSSTVLGAGKALQVLFKPQREDTFVMLDRRLRLSSGQLGNTGMLARMKVGTGGSGDGGTVVPGLAFWVVPTAVNDLFVLNQGGGSVAARGVLANDTGNSFDGFNPVGIAAERNNAVATRYGTATLNADGSFTYVPTNPSAFSVDSLAGLPASCKNAVLGRDNFSYFAVHTATKPGNAGPLKSAAANVDIELKQANDAPTTTSPDYFYATTNSGALAVTGTGYLANDIDADVDCDTLLRATELTPVLAAGGPYMNTTKTASLISFGANPDGSGNGAFTAALNAPTALGTSRFTYRATDLGGLKGAVGTVYAVRDAYIDVDLVNDLLSATSYKRATATTANRWTIRMAGRPITVAGIPKTYKLTFYAVFNGTTTQIGTSVLNTLQGSATSRTFNYATPLFTGPGGLPLPEHSLMGLKVVIDVPSDGIIPAHRVTLDSNIPVL